MAPPQPFRFGLNGINGSTRHAWQETARKAEAFGYSTLVVGDHIWTQLAPLTSLVAAAEATTTLRVGSYVFGNDFWHPTVLAREAATIDVLSEGRLEFGIGTGWERADYVQRGMILDSPGVRRRRLAEAIHVIKGLFAVAPLTFAGTYYTINGLDSYPKPLQQPHPPFLIGGGGPRMLALAAQDADIVGVNMQTTADGKIDGRSMTAQAVDQKIGWIRAAAGARFNAIELNILVFINITDDRHGAAAQVATDWGLTDQGLSIDDVLESPYFLFGTVDQMVEDLRQRRERYGISYFTVFGEEHLDTFAPIVARLSGT
jgi:probable F420-dependent oxidoreductase